jgi:hypothetical protein
VLGVADAVGAGSVAIIGQSSDATIAMTCAQLGPSRVERLVLVDLAGSPDQRSVVPEAASVSRLGTVYPSAQAALALIKQAGLIPGWDEYWDRYFAYELREVSSGVASASDRGAVLEDLGYGLRQVPREAPAQNLPICAACVASHHLGKPTITAGRRAVISRAGVLSAKRAPNRPSAQPESLCTAVQPRERTNLPPTGSRAVVAQAVRGGARVLALARRRPSCLGRACYPVLTSVEAWAGGRVRTDVGGAPCRPGEHGRMRVEDAVGANRSQLGLALPTYQGHSAGVSVARAPGGSSAAWAPQGGQRNEWGSRLSAGI